MKRLVIAAGAEGQQVSLKFHVGGAITQETLRSQNQDAD